MKGCAIPAPAPCASTRHALARSGNSKRPETTWVWLTRTVRGCGVWGSTFMFVHHRNCRAPAVSRQMSSRISKRGFRRNAPLPLPVRGRQDDAMSRDPRSANRKQGKARRQHPIVVRRLLPLAAATLIFAVFLVLDPAAVARLIWLCLKGSLGAPPQIAALVGLFVLLAMTLWVLQLVPSRWSRNRRKPAGTRMRRVSKAAASRKHGKGR